MLDKLQVAGVRRFNGIISGATNEAVMTNIRAFLT